MSHYQVAMKTVHKIQPKLTSIGYYLKIIIYMQLIKIETNISNMCEIQVLMLALITDTGTHSYKQTYEFNYLYKWCRNC